MLKQFRAFVLGILITLLVFQVIGIYKRIDRIEKFLDFLSQHIEFPAQ